MISFLQKINSNGGPKNFQIKFFLWLDKKNIKFDFCDDFFKKRKIIFVNAGSKRIIYLIFQKLMGAKIIQRLDGLNDLEDFSDYNVKFKAFLSNLSMNFIRKRVAEKIIYQSLFVKERWESRFGTTLAISKIIHNPYFDKENSNFFPNKKIDILIMEGNIQNNEKTKKLLNFIFEAVKKNNRIYKVYILGNSCFEIKKIYKKYKNEVIDLGFISRQNLLKLMRKKKFIYFPIEFKASCPNSYIELISRGVPSCFINGGSLSELSKFSSVKINASSINISLINKINFAFNKIMKNYFVYNKLSKLMSRRYDNTKIFQKYFEFIKY